MTINPEEKVNKELWYVLQRLKEEYLRTKVGHPLEYWVDFSFVGGEGPSARNEEKALEKLEESGVIEIVNSGWEYE